jgi:heat shock protein HtpX
MNLAKTVFLMTLMTVLLVFGGRMIGGETGMVFAFGFALVMNVGSYWFSDKIVLKMYRARQVTEAEAPRLYSVVRNLATRARLPMPKVYIIPDSTPNAFATGRNPEHSAVAVTEGILGLLDTDELSGVLGHELAHIRNRDILIGTIAATIAGAISMLAHWAQWAMMFGGFGGNRDNNNPLGVVGLLAMVILMPLAAMLIQMAVSRSREYDADYWGSRICGDPDYLARALAKLDQGVRRDPMDAQPATAHMFIVNPLSGKDLSSLFSTHPSIEDRIRRLREMRLVTT